MAKSNNSESVIWNLIAAGTSINGDIITAGDLRIDGKVEGNLEVKGKLIVGKTGEILGKVECVEADISGLISGDLKVKQLLSIQSTARIEGDVVTAQIIIEQGAVFSVSCTMDQTKKEQKA